MLLVGLSLFQVAEKEKSYVYWLHGLAGRMVIFRGSFGSSPSCSSSCWKQSEEGIIFLLVTLPRMRGNPQSVGFFGGGVGVEMEWQVMGQGNEIVL